MRIGDIRQERSADGATVSARVVWEDVAQAPVRIEVGVEGPVAADLRPRPAPFLVAAAIPAFLRGESRVAVEGPVCPRLRDGLIAATQIAGRWWGPPRPALRIEATGGFRAAESPAAPRAGLFLSGGVDSLSVLATNRRNIPAGHPAAIRDALFVYGLDMGAQGDAGDRRRYRRAQAALAEVAAEAGVELVPMHTTIRRLDADSRVSWPDQWVAAATIAAAHCLAGRLDRVLLAASQHMPECEPAGSHPLLDPCFSGEALQVIHAGAHLSRLDKIELVGRWPVALRNLRVCYQPIPADGALNCGRCLKCVRTMLGLIAVGRLDEAVTFAVRDVTPEMIPPIPVDRPRLVHFYRSVLAPLESRGRADLAADIRRKIAAHERLTAWHTARGVRGALRRLGGKLLGGASRRPSTRRD